MTDRSTLLELAERCEKATGPDRELDGAIDRIFHQRPKHGDYDATERAIWRVTDAWSGLLVRGDGYARGSFCADRYTASLDAAMTLVPQGASWSLYDVIGKPESVRMWGFNGCDILLSAATPALALTAAALRALANQPEDKSQ